MKTILKTALTVFAFIAFQTVTAQEQAVPQPVVQPEAAHKHNDMTSWPELKAFHVAISQTFHPSEEGNFAPIRERSGELHDKAVTLQNSKIPNDFNTPEIIAATKDLSAKTKQLDDVVKSKGTDEKVNELLIATHDSFHQIVGLCQGGDSHDEREQHKE